ncbi:MAG: SUMF1/EgtB/PvdO family nonheme iron enzyme [Treponema sp.]|nr:SUMF1/EgtB/PvdO family nonheme iron enzyme [Treponema sp.]
MKKTRSVIVILVLFSILCSICACKVDVEQPEYPVMENPQYNLCTVTFDTNGGSHVSSQILLSGTTATEPKDPSIKDGEFLGWYADSNFSNEFNLETAITGDVTLYAKWLAKVCFVDENENVIHTYWVESGNKIPFSGHISSRYQVYTDKECTQPFDFKCKILSPIKLYMIYEGNLQSMICGKFQKIGGGFINCDSLNLTGLHGLTVNDFFICDHEVTQAEFSSVMGRNPSTYIGADKPVDSVSWYDAIEYCNKLSQMEGFTPCYTINKNTIPNQLDDLNWDVTCDFSADGYRLPTQTEWLYAARRGRNTYTNTNELMLNDDGTIRVWLSLDDIYSGIAQNRIEEGRFIYTYTPLDAKSVDDNLSFPDSETALDYVAWYEGNSGGETHDVMTKAPNRNSLYDMTGNVREWCWDEWDKAKKIGFNGRRALGGSYESVTSSSRHTDFCRLLNTENEQSHQSINNSLAFYAYEDIGFRVVRSCSE